MTAAHTPGPWHQDKWGAVKAPNGETVKFSSLTLSMGHNGEIQANDRLVAAAPDLLAALQEISAVDGHTILTVAESDAITARVRAAIAKATGAAQ